MFNARHGFGAICLSGVACCVRARWGGAEVANVIIAKRLTLMEYTRQKRA